jgi:hypothetical protein
MVALRRLLWTAFLCALAGLCLLLAVVLLVALVVVLYWDARVTALAILSALFAAGGAVAILVVRARARTTYQLAALAGAVEIVYWSLRGLRWLARR